MKYYNLQYQHFFYVITYDGMLASGKEKKNKKLFENVAYVAVWVVWREPQKVFNQNPYTL